MKYCDFVNCKKKISISLYDVLICKICLKHFCFIHRIPEDHNCDLDFIKNKYKKDLSDKLLNEAIKCQKINFF